MTVCRPGYPWSVGIDDERTFVLHANEDGLRYPVLEARDTGIRMCLDELVDDANRGAAGVPDHDEHDVPLTLDDFSEMDVVDNLESRGYIVGTDKFGILDEIGEDAAVEWLEDHGYTVTKGGTDADCDN